jgi:ABC-type branched-subunit amino acid transport system substrate-binding protein
MKNLRKVGAVVAFVAASSLFLAGCSGPRTADSSEAENSPGITDTDVLVGSSQPLSGSLTASGTAANGGFLAYLESANDQGGVEMADGKTRTVTLKYYDDGYDPARATSNFQRLVDQDGIFAYINALGTATNLAIMPSANSLGVPQILPQTGNAAFSNDRPAHPWTLGFQPTYQREGRAYGEYLVSLDKPIRLAFLHQDDDQGKAFQEGLEEAIAGSKVEIVAQTTYTPTDTTLDSQISQLAASGADAFMMAVLFPALVVQSVQKMAELQWQPITYLPQAASSVSQVVGPSDAANTLPQLFSSSYFVDVCGSGAASDPTVAKYLDDMAKYAPDADACLAQSICGYMSAAFFVEALKGMAEPTRQALMDSIAQIKTSDLPLLRPGLTVDGSDTGTAPVGNTQLIQFQSGAWVTAGD